MSTWVEWAVGSAAVAIALACLVMTLRSAHQVDGRNTYTSISGRRRHRSSADGSRFWGRYLERDGR